jgi:hypothetical protein
MTTLAWYVFGVSFFLFHLLNYLLVGALRRNHPDLYRELGTPSDFHFLLYRSDFISHPYTALILRRQYQARLAPFRELGQMARAVFACGVVCLTAGLTLWLVLPP